MKSLYMFIFIKSNTSVSMMLLIRVNNMLYCKEVPIKLVIYVDIVKEVPNKKFYINN